MNYLLLILITASITFILTGGTVEKSDVAIYTYSQSNPYTYNQTFNLSQNNTFCSYLDTSKATIFIIHGWTNYTTSDFTNDSLNIDILSQIDVNLLVVDYLYRSDYLQAVADAQTVGTYLAEFIDSIRNCNNYSLVIKLIGHSLGAQICGYIGKYAKSAIPVIIALDPAGPGFIGTSSESHLASTDGTTVEVIHTSSDVGYYVSCGTADFWPNYGIIQPNCITSVNSSLTAIQCSHLIAIKYFRESVLNQTKYIGKQCSSYAVYKTGLCTGPTAYMGGLSPDSSANGDYYLDIN